jgi:AcrR family transcriptional regulator
VNTPTKQDGRSVRWDAHRLARRAELVRAAMTAVEIHGATVGMDQIAAVAGTSKAVFYRHFTDKADLYRAVGQQLAQQFRDQLSGKIASQSDARTMLAAGIDGFLAVLQKTPELYRFVVQNPVVERSGEAPVLDYISLISARVSELIAPLVEASGTTRVAAKPWAAAIVGYVKAAGDWWLDNPGQLTRAELTESLTVLLWSGASGIVVRPEGRATH